MIRRLAASAGRHPRLYHARVLAVAALGYVLVLGVLLAAVAVAISIVVVAVRTDEYRPMKLLVPVLAFIGLLVESLWIDVAPPKGVVLGRNEAPALWAEIERVRRAMGAPAPYQVLVTGELNAWVQQVPRLGVLGFYRTYLGIGLPLAASLTADELRAVLAHEFGHVSRKHGRLVVWIFRVRETWEQMLETLEGERHWTRGPLRAFLQWYLPFLDAYMVVLRRAFEFEADRHAARVAGSVPAAGELCRVAVADRWLEGVFWPAVFRGMARQPQAPADVFRHLLREAPGAAQQPDAAAWLREEMGQPTQPWDTHPSLAERLAALGARPVLPGAPAEPSGAVAFFGEHLERVAGRLGRRWADATQFTWRRQHEQHLRTAERLSALEARAAEQPLSADEARERILLTVQLRGQTVAIPLMRGFLDAGQDDASVHFLLGRTLLEEGDEAGLRHVERAMELDADAVPAGCELAAGFLEERGRGAEARTYHRRGQAHAETLQRAQAERDPRHLSANDRFLPHGLDEGQVKALAGQLALVGGLKRALLVRKVVTLHPEVPCFVLLVEPAFNPEAEVDGGNPSHQLVPRVAKAVNAPGTLMVLMLCSARALDAAIQRVPGAEVYTRPLRARAAAR